MADPTTHWPPIIASMSLPPLWSTPMDSPMKSFEVVDAGEKSLRKPLVPGADTDMSFPGLMNNIVLVPLPLPVPAPTTWNTKL